MRIVRCSILGLFLLVVAALLWIAGVSTCFITCDAAEHTYFVADSLLANVAVSVGILGVAWFVLSRTDGLRARLNADAKAFKVARIALLAFAAVVTAVWVLLTQALPGSDALSVQKAAAAALSGDYSAFANDAYMGTYLNQAGLFLISYLFAIVAGPNSYLAFQLFNVVGAVIVVKMVGDLSGLLGASRAQQLGAMVAAFAFFPFLQYASFVYGNVWGLAFSLIAVKHELVFFEGRDWRHAAASALSICVAMAFKGNYVVFFIAMAIYALIELLRNRDDRTLLLACMIAVAFAVQAVVPVAAARAVSGYPLDEGCSSWSWVAMGLQDGERAPGWYNGYNQKSYKSAWYDSEKQAAAAKLSIARSVYGFSQDPGDAAAFFVRKTASQWNNPTFQGFWNVQVRDARVPLGSFARWLTGVEGSDAAARYLNFLQFFVLLGTAFWCLSLRWTERHVDARLLRDVLLPLVFLGGFVCHLLWEAKCQYTLSYFELLLPLAVMGHARFISFMRERLRSGWAKGVGRMPSSGSNPSSNGVLSLSPSSKLAVSGSDAIAKSVCAVLVAACVLAFYISPASSCLSGDEQAYQSYLAENPTVNLASKT